MNRRSAFFYLGLILVLVMLVAGIGCSSQTDSSDKSSDDKSSGDKAEPQIMEMSYLGGSWGENLAFALAGSELVTQYAPNVKVSIVKSAGSEMNTMMAATMPANSVLYHTTSMDFVASYFGIEPWDEAYPDQRLLTSYNPGALAFIGTVKDGRLEDMEGKTISVLPLPSLQLPFLMKCLDILGMKDKVKISQLDFGAKEDALRDGTTDAQLASVYNPEGYEALNPGMEEVRYSLKDKLYWITVPKEVVAEAAASLNAGFGVREIKPGNMLPMETRSNYGHTVVFSALAVKKGMSEELAYQVTKAILEHTDQFENYDAGGKYVNPQSVAEAMAYASEEMIHPGAVRYYKEAGLWDHYLKARQEFVEVVGDYQ